MYYLQYHLQKVLHKETQLLGFQRNVANFYNFNHILRRLANENGKYNHISA